MAEWMVPCSICDQEVDAYARFTYHRVVGWERSGKAGGSDIVGRQRLEVYAHPLCVDRLNKGLLGQEQLQV